MWIIRHHRILVCYATGGEKSGQKDQCRHSFLFGEVRRRAAGFYVSLHRKYKCIIDGWETKLVFCANWYYEYEYEYECEYEYNSFQLLWGIPPPP